MDEPKIQFEWDETKAANNLRKHHVDFEEAKTAFNDPVALIYEDDMHSDEEPRELLLGYSNRNRLLLVAFVQRLYNLIRIISARLADKGEHKKYEQEKRF